MPLIEVKLDSIGSAAPNYFAGSAVRGCADFTARLAEL